MASKHERDLLRLAQPRGRMKNGVFALPADAGIRVKTGTAHPFPRPVLKRKSSSRETS